VIELDFVAADSPELWSLEVAMQVWWTFRCDANDTWEALVADTDEPTAELTRCPVDGGEAVTASPGEPADRVRVAIVPAARIADPATGAVTRDRDYYLEILSADGTQHRRSARSYTWEEVVSRAALFRGASWQDALRRWERAALDRVPAAQGRPRRG
jgi:hypothetical protein